MEEQGLSIRDRIKALNQSQSKQQSDHPKSPPNKPVPGEKENKIKVSIQAAKSKEDEIYLSPTSNKRIQYGITDQAPAASHGDNEKITYECNCEVPSANRRLTPALTSSESKGCDDGNYVIMRPTALGNTPVLTAVDGSDKKDLRRKDGERDYDNNEYASPSSDSVSSDHYATPKDLPIGYDDRDRTLIPQNIGSRWQKARQTVNDFGMRQMVDMSKLTSRPPVETTTSERILTMEDGHDSTVERSTIRASTASAITGHAKIDGISHAPHGKLSPGIGSRNSSYKSNISRESGSFSDASDTTSSTSEFGRPRIISDVSVSCDEDNYISFGTVDDAIGDPSERILVAVKGKAYAERLNLAQDDSGKSWTAVQRVSNTKREYQEKKTQTNNKFKSAVKNKLAKAIQTKISTNSSPTKRLSTNQNLSKSLPASPAKSPSPNVGRNSGNGQKYSHPSYQRHASNSFEFVPKSEISGPFESYPRPPSVSVSIDENAEDESRNIYCEPFRTTPSSHFLSTEASTPKSRNVTRGSVRSLESNNHEDKQDDWYASQLSWEKRSRSLVNLRDDDISSFEIRGRSEGGDHSQWWSGNEDDGVYLQSIGSSLPQPPTHLQNGRTGNVLSTANHEESQVKLTAKRLNASKVDKRRLPGLTSNVTHSPTSPLPMSMPPDEPPPPRPSSMPPDAPTPVDTSANKEDSEPRKVPVTSVSPPHDRHLPNERNPAQQFKSAIKEQSKDRRTCQEDGSDSKEQESFYYTVDDGQESAKAHADKPTVLPKPGIPQKPSKFVKASTNHESEIGKDDESLKSAKFHSANFSVKEISKMLSTSIATVQPTIRQKVIDESKSNDDIKSAPQRHLPSYQTNSVEPLKEAAKPHGRIPRHASSPAIPVMPIAAATRKSSYSTTPNRSILTDRHNYPGGVRAPSKKRSTITRPTTAPPPRPDAAPPAPPSTPKKTQDLKRTITPPPRRPPPPSPDKIQAAAERRRMQTLTEECADADYQDTFIQGEVSEENISNIYASIDEEIDTDNTRDATEQSYRNLLSKTNFKFPSILQGKFPFRIEKNVSLEEVAQPKKHIEEVLYAGIDDIEV